MQVNSKKRLLKILIVYYGILQTAHLVSLIRAGIILLNEGRIAFPASPPAQGWDKQALYFLVGMSIFDTGNILITIIFIYAYFASKEWSSLIGIINLTAMISSGAFFALGTFPSGAWFVHPFEYLLITFLFLPIILLFFLFTYQSSK